MNGYFDRIEDGNLAVILVEEQGKEFIIPVEALPEGSQPKSWFHLVLEEERIVSIEIDHEKTASQQQKVNHLLAKLRSKRNDSKFMK